MNDRNTQQSEIDKISEWREWLRYAEMDYDCASYLNEMPLHPRPYEIICYHCQQTAEKAIKALIVSLGSQGGMPKVYNISFLINQIKDQLKDTKGIIIEESLYDAADFLTPYGIVPRYPSEMEFSDLETNEALNDAKTILEWVKAVLIV